MRKEIWKNIVGYEGLYKVSSRGKVCRLTDGTYYKKRENIVVSTVKGYPVARLYKNKKGHTYCVHQLVLTAFKGSCPKGKESSHLNDVKTDNNLNNLEWMTSSENRRLAHKNGRYK